MMLKLPRERLRERLSKDMRIFEIGPFINPCAARRDGWDTFIVDLKSREELIEAYRHIPGIEALEEVDLVWPGGDLHSLFPERSLESFDTVICSHVLEHIPDPIAFLASVSRLLRPDGQLLLMLPDRRFTFDYFRGLSLTGDLVEAHRLEARTHARRTAFNQVAYGVVKEGLLGWNQDFVSRLDFIADLDAALVSCDAVGQGGPWSQDYHAWCFVPSSFELVVLELCHLGLIDLCVETITPTDRGEFFVALKRAHDRPPSGEALVRERSRLLGKIMWEVALQTRLARAGGLLGGRDRGVMPELLVASFDRLAPWLAERRLVRIAYRAWLRLRDRHRAATDPVR